MLAPTGVVNGVTMLTRRCGTTFGKDFDGRLVLRIAALLHNMDHRVGPFDCCRSSGSRLSLVSGHLVSCTAVDCLLSAGVYKTQSAIPPYKSQT